MSHHAPIFVLSHYGGLPAAFEPFVRDGHLEGVWEWDLTKERIAAARGIVLTIHLDQLRATEWRDELGMMLARGGRILINGHVEQAFIAGVGRFAAGGRGREHLRLSKLGEHPVFDGVDRLAFETRRGVAGFYGRGHNAMPDGAQALTGVGPDMAPLDWVWRRTDGGTVLSHAGNDLWTSCDETDVVDRLAANIVRWLGHKTER
ncbi:MAG: hypothetical protein JNL71_16705 [Rhodospirillales bacterium]|nr:hypothetical protein [Rhodospirillales bacterium]